MIVAKSIIIVGVIAIILGTVFHLQSQSILGPESSFMYSNPEWSTYGFQISVLGIITTGIGIGLSLMKKFR